jgi:hypothetical protein
MGGGWVGGPAGRPAGRLARPDPDRNRRPPAPPCTAVLPCTLACACLVTGCRDVFHPVLCRSAASRPMLVGQSDVAPKFTTHPVSQEVCAPCRAWRVACGITLRCGALVGSPRWWWTTTSCPMCVNVCVCVVWVGVPLAGTGTVGCRWPWATTCTWSWTPAACPRPPTSGCTMAWHCLGTPPTSCSCRCSFLTMWGRTPAAPSTRWGQTCRQWPW